MQERSSKMCLTQFRAGIWPPVSQFKGEISNQLAADSITKWVTVSTLSFCSLPISTLKNFWTKVSPNAFLISSLWLLLSAYTQWDTAVFVEHSYFVSSKFWDWVLRHKVRSYFHNFLLAFLKAEISYTIRDHNTIQRFGTPLRATWKVEHVQNIDVCPFRWSSLRQYNLFFLQSISTHIKRMQTFLVSYH